LSRASTQARGPVAGDRRIDLGAHRRRHPGQRHPLLHERRHAQAPGDVGGRRRAGRVVEAAARLADAQAGRQRAVERRRLAAELGHHHPRGLDAEVADRLVDGGERRGGEARVVDVVEPHHGDGGGDADAPAVQRLQDAERRPVVGRHDGVAPPPLVEQPVHRRQARVAREVAGDDQVGVDGEAVLGEARAVTRQALLGLDVARRAGDERDPPPVVHADEVRGELPDAGGVVDEQRADAVHLVADAAQGQRAEPAAEGQHGRRPHLVGQCAGRQDDAVHAPGADQVVDGALRDRLLRGARQPAARETIEVDAPARQLLVGAEQDFVLVAVRQRVREQPDAPPAAHARRYGIQVGPVFPEAPSAESALCRRCLRRGARSGWAWPLGVGES
jgi:hypothetical protein